MSGSWTSLEFIYGKIIKKALPMIIYTDGSCKKTMGWAWCAADDERFDYGCNVISPSSFCAELLAVKYALTAIKERDIIIVNDNVTVIDLLNNKKIPKVQECSIIDEVLLLIKHRNVTCHYPPQKNKGKHGWCHAASRAASLTPKAYDSFNKWWNSISRNEESKDVALLAWSAAIKDKKAIPHPPKEEIIQLEYAFGIPQSNELKIFIPDSKPIVPKPVEFKLLFPVVKPVKKRPLNSCYVDE